MLRNTNKLYAPPPISVNGQDELMPLKYSIERTKDAAFLKIETSVGRSLWLSHIKRMATKNITILLNHKWHIMKVAPRFEWPTSDDPVIRLSYQNERQYTFDGGIRQKNAEILFPLSPTRLLYTRVGSNQSMDRFNSDAWFSKLVFRLILEHSFLYVYSKRQLKGISQQCPRVVDEVEYRRIEAMLKNWHLDNTKGEQEFFKHE